MTHNILPNVFVFLGWEVRELYIKITNVFFSTFMRSYKTKDTWKLFQSSGSLLRITRKMNKEKKKDNNKVQKIDSVVED